jgi:hypothetical protein
MTFAHHPFLYNKLSQNGQAANAEIVSVHADNVGDALRGNRRYTMQVRVVTAGQEPFEAEIAALFGVFTPHAGDTIDVLYDLNDHSKIVVASGDGNGANCLHSKSDAELDSAEIEADKLVNHALDLFEPRWCDKPSPQLDGLTPREAAKDPARRNALEQLISEVSSAPPHMRPSRLRELLGL